MKELNYLEAHSALADGECVAQVFGPEHLGPAHKWNPDTERVEVFYITDFERDGKWFAAVLDNSTGKGRYQIVPDPTKPEPKTLSFDEAAEIVARGGFVKIHKNNTSFHLDYEAGPKPLEHWWQHLAMLDLAERRGWPITKA